MTAATTTLAEFLLARIAEDEDFARAAQASRGDGRWNAQQLNHEGLDVWASGDGGDLSFDDPDELPVLQYLVRNDPAHVLAECEAKRRIVEESRRPGETEPDFDAGWESALEFALQCLALPYADRPDYRQEWRP